MSEKKKLEKIHKTASDKCYENRAILDSLILNSQACSAKCHVLLEMVQKRNSKISEKIEESREILDIAD